MVVMQAAVALRDTSGMPVVDFIDYIKTSQCNFVELSETSY
jgi:hypothetical protein